MKILGISGSPRKGGNTDILVNRALEICRKNRLDTEFISLADREINYCMACYHCSKKNNFRCIQDDDVPEILRIMENSDAIIIGSPTYFASVSGKLKSLFDRSLPLRRNNFRLSGKIGGAIAVGGSRNGGQEFVCRDIHNWMLLHEMIVVADRTTAHFGGIAVGRVPEDVQNDSTGLETVDNLALNILKALERIKKKEK